MAYPARVRGGFYLLRVGVRTAYTGYEIDVLTLGKMRQLVKSDNVVFRTLILVNIVFTGTVAEIYHRSVTEFPHMGGGVEAVQLSRKYAECTPDDRFFKLGKGPAQDELL